MNTSVNTYLDELAAGLRSRGLTSDEADEIVREAASHVREAGGDPVETLGPLDEKNSCALRIRWRRPSPRC